MTYSVEKLKTAEDCNELLAVKTKEENDLTFKKTSLERKKEDYAERFTKLEADKIANDSEISAVETTIAQLETSELKDEMEARLKKLKYRQFLLEEKSENYGTIALLEKEMEIALVDQQLAELTVFTQAITDHMNTL